jgi:hypothetical protein
MELERQIQEQEAYLAKLQANGEPLAAGASDA